MTERPKRIQLRRVKGWRKPPGAVSVARPGPWGNPFRVGVHGTAAECVEKYRRLLDGLIDTTSHPAPEYGAQAAALDHAREQLHTLRGRDLACWCPPDGPCHADVLIEMERGGGQVEWLVCRPPDVRGTIHLLPGPTAKFRPSAKSGRTTPGPQIVNERTETMRLLPIKRARDIAQKYGWDQVIIVARKTGSDGVEHVVTYGVDEAHCEAVARAGMAIKHHLMQWPCSLFDGDLRLIGTGADTDNPQAISLAFSREITDDDIRLVHDFLKPPTYSPKEVEDGA